MFLIHFPHVTHDRPFLLSAIISPVLKEAHLLKIVFLQPGRRCKLSIPGSHPRSIQSEELGRGALESAHCQVLSGVSFVHQELRTIVRVRLCKEIRPELCIF